MGAAKKLVDKKALRDLVPLNALSPMHVDEIALKAVIEEVRSGRYIFKQGDRDNQSIYILSGEVSIIGDDNEVLGSVHGGSDAARHPIGHQQPRQVSARAKTNAVVARIDSSLLDILLTWDESSGYEVNEIDAEDEEDWMTKMLQSPAFLQLPPANIQRLLMKMESVPVQAGEVIVRQGDEGDYFYVVTTGRCVVTRKATAQGQEVKLAELGDGASFGEDALVSSNKRNATITMLTDGTLSRLAKQDFQELLQAPLVHQLNYEQAAKLAEEGAIWLDVRLPGEFENSAIPGARNIPLSGLRDPSTQLDEDDRYILCCDTGRRSASGAFVLSQRGLDVYVLDGGLQSVPGSVLVSADGSPVAAAATSPVAEVIPMEAVVEETAGDADDRLRDLKARYDKEVERIKAFQESARQTIQSAQQARKAAEEQVAELTGQLQQAQAALEQAQGSGQTQDAIQDLEARLVRAIEAQEQLRGELRDAQESQIEAESRLKEYEQQLAQGQQSAASELKEAQAELNASQQQISGLEEGRIQLEEQVQRLTADLAASRGDSETRLQQLMEERDALRTELEGARGELQEVSARLQALDDARIQSEGQLTDLRATLEQVQADAGQQQTDLRAELDAVRMELEQARDTHLAAEQAREELSTRHQSAVAEQEKLLAQLTEARQEAESERTLARNRVESLEEDLLQFKRTHEELGERASSLAAERDAARQQAEKLQQQHDALQKKLSEQETAGGEQVETLRQELEAVLSEREQLQSRLAGLEQSLATGREQVAELQSEISGYQTQLQEQQQATSEAGSRETALQAQLAQAQEQRESLESQLTRQSEQLQEGEVQRTALQARLDELQAGLGNSESRTAELEQLLEQTRSEEAQLRQELDSARMQAEAALAEAREQVESAQQALGEEKETLQQDLERLRGELAVRDQSLQEQQSRLVQLEQAREEVEANLAAAQAGHEQLQQELQQELAAAQQALSEHATTSAAQLEEQERQHRQRIEALEAELESQLHTVETRTTEHNTLQTELEGIQAEHAALQQQLAALQEQLTSAESAYQQRDGAHQQEIAHLQAELESLKGGEADLDAERQRLQQELEAAQAELGAGRQQADALQAELDAAVARQTEQEQQLEQLQASLGDQQEAAAGFDTERQRLQEVLEATRVELDGVRASGETARNQLRTELEAALTARDDLQSALEALQAEMATQPADEAPTAELQSLQQRLEEQQALVSSMRLEMVELTEERDEERTTLQGQLEAARKDLEGANTELLQLRQEQEQLLTGDAEAAAATARASDLDVQLATLRQQLEVAQSDAAELRTRETAMREEMDKLRAEAEVAQGLAELHSDHEDGIDTAHMQQELSQARQNVQIAVRLRTEAEEGRRQAEMELQRVRDELATRHSEGAPHVHTISVPSLDDDDEAAPVATVVVEPEPVPVAAVVAPEMPESKGKGGLLAGAVLGLALGVGGAGGAFYFLKSDSTGSSATMTAAAPVATIPPVPAPVEVPEPGPEPERKVVPEVVKAVPEPERKAVPEVVKAVPEPERKAVPEVVPVNEPEAPVAVSATPVVVPDPAPVPTVIPVARNFSDSLRDGSRGPQLVELRATQFVMGSGQASPNFDERPRHEVSLGVYAIARQEVTFAEYDRFARATGRALPDDMGWGRDNQPAINVSWGDAVAYTEWLSQQTGKTYRLPTEAEWEYAARGGSEERFWWGSEVGVGRANCFDCGDQWGGKRTAPVGSFAANPYGLQDMNGNVQEWVQDCYRDSYQGAPADGRAVEGSDCRRVVRGGGYTNASEILRSAARASLEPDSRLDHVGFRVVRTN